MTEAPERKPITEHTADTLRAFEADIAAEFNAGRIRAPVHLSGGNEGALLRVFQAVRPQDWVVTTWRSHYHCLLKGVPAARLKTDIMQGRSITLTYPDYKIVSSAIVAGALPIAVGLALHIKRDPTADRAAKVWAFVGDMAAQTGTFNECMKYAFGHFLPIRFVVEDNGISVCTPTAAAWGGTPPHYTGHISSYSYKLAWPHAGAGKRVQF